MYYPATSLHVTSSIIRRSYVTSFRLMSSSQLHQKLSDSKWYTMKNGTSPMRSLLVPSRIMLQPRAELNKMKFERSRTVAKLYAKDGISQKYEMIYRSDIDTYFIGFQILLLLFLTVTVWAVLVIIGNDSSIEEIKEDLKKGMAASDEAVPKPIIEDNTALPLKFAEIGQDDIYLLYTCLGTVFMMMLTIMKLQRVIPVRVYLAPSGHCVSAHMSALIPTRTRQREFVAGTLKRYYSTPNPTFTLSQCFYKDATGHLIMLFDASFRSIQDLHHLLDPNDDEINRF